MNLREGQAWRGPALPDEQPWVTATNQLEKWGQPLNISWDILLSKGGLFIGMGLTPMLKESRVAPRSTLTCQSGILTSSLVLGETRTWSSGPREKCFHYSPCLQMPARSFIPVGKDCGCSRWGAAGGSHRV